MFIIPDIGNPTKTILVKGFPMQLLLLFCPFMVVLHAAFGHTEWAFDVNLVLLDVFHFRWTLPCSLVTKKEWKSMMFILDEIIVAHSRYWERSETILL